MRTLLSLPSDERGKIFTALLMATLGEEPQELAPLESAIFELIMSQVERAHALSAKRSQAGSRGGAPNGNTNATNEQTQTSKFKQKQANAADVQPKSNTSTDTSTITSTNTNIISPAGDAGDAPTAREVSVLEQRFNEFWEIYPKKVAKQTAFNAWKKAKPSAELHKRILEAIEAAKRSDKWLRDNGQYIPNPATWLNGGCWDDEISLNTGGLANHGGNEPGAGFTPKPSTYADLPGFRNALDRYDDEGRRIDRDGK